MLPPRLLTCMVATLLTLAHPAFADAPPIPADVRKLVQDNTTFALDLYSRLSSQKGNLFFSPYSITTAVAMASAGARGETAAQMSQAMHFSLTPNALHPACSELIKQINNHGLPRSYQLSVAQALWVDSDVLFHLRREFVALLHDNYGARLEPAFFRHRPQAARLSVNNWVAQRTYDRIKEVVNEGDITSNTRLLLVNALYFKAAWRTPFDRAFTTVADFHSPARIVKVPMMDQVETVNYAKAKGLGLIELPYLDAEASMIVLLPEQKTGLAALEKSLTPAALQAAIDKMRPAHVEVKFPRLKLTTNMQLRDELIAMGMRLAFSKEADFSGIT